MIIKRGIACFIIGAALTATGCGALTIPPGTMIKPPVSANSEIVDNNMIEIVNKFLPADARLINPQNPAGSKSVQLKDLDQDGKDEIIALYKGKESQAGMLVLKQTDDEWKKILDYTSEGTDVNYFKIAAITNAEKPDIAVGWNIGATLNGLDIFSWENNQLQKVASDSYTKIELEDMPNKNGETDGKNEIALWQHDTGEAFIIDVYRLNGTELVPAQDVYPYYFAKIADYYQQKVKEMPDSAFYWYYLAEAQIKAEQPEAALKSIEAGLAVKAKNPDHYPSNEEFEQLRNKL